MVWIVHRSEYFLTVSIQAVGGPIGAIYAIDLEKRENEEEV